MVSSRSHMAFLFSVAIMFQVAIKVYADYEPWYVDIIVRYCEIKTRTFAATEDKYAEKGPQMPNKPELFSKPFIVEQQIEANELELRQRTFECIADMLHIFSDQTLQSSDSYYNLVQECRSVQPTTPHCDPSYPYRLINGTCNNLLQPRWGSTFDCFRRLWPPNYEGVSGLRKSVQGGRPLPNPRDISRMLINADSKPSADYNTLFAFFGQIVAHDIAQFSSTMVHGSKRLDCCPETKRKNKHPQCVPISLKPADVFYSAQNVSCLNIARIIPCITCSVGKRIPMNYLTAYIDCSLVYGQTDARAYKVRRNDGSGKLKAQHKECGELLLADKTKNSTCGDFAKQEYCFQSGDFRLDQHTILMILQTLLLREHNRIASKLKILNSHWGEERLYQEARRVLIAEFQVIIFKEYLPILLGPKLIYEYGLNIGSGSNYDPSIDPSISVEFNCVAFRIHSIIPSKVVFDEDVQFLKELYQNSLPLYNDRMSSYFVKMANNYAEKFGTFMATDMTLFLYKLLNGTWGFDLAAVDIQRGRDIGLPTYVQVLEYMEKRPGTIGTFCDLKHYIIPECLHIVEKIYSDVRDIDLYVGIICEIIPNGMIISPTAAKIIAEQFARLRFGDRFHFEHDPTFTSEQRTTLTRASLAKLICDNTNVEIIQPAVMLFSSFSNVPQFCSEIPDVDLMEWKE